MIPGMDAQKNRSSFVLFLGLSVLLHIFALLGLYYARMEPIDLSENTVFIDLTSAPPVDLAEEKEKPRQIVETEKADNAEKPKDAKYLGERDQLVKEETKAKRVDSFRDGGKASAGQKGQSFSLKDLAPAKQIAPPTQQEVDAYKQAREQQVAASQGAEANPGAATNDYLKDAKEGDRTMLSTREFVYFGYYQRIRKRLEVAWNSRLRSTLETYGVGRQLASNQDYVTGVIVVLDRFGQITAVQVLRRSGAHDLDQAAVDAFNSAGPFPDPPSGLIDDKGEIRIRWDFILQS